MKIDTDGKKDNMVGERGRIILEDLEQTLLEFIYKHQITHDEYRCATDTLVASVKAGEESLLYDVFIEAATTNTRNINNRGSLVANTASESNLAKTPFSGTIASNLVKTPFSGSKESTVQIRNVRIADYSGANPN